MTVQQLNAETIDLLTAFLVARGEPNYVIGQVIGTYTMMHGARSLMLFSIQKETNAEHLIGIIYPNDNMTPVGSPVRATEGLFTYGVFDGTDDYYWDGASNRGKFDLGLSIVAWVRFDEASLGNTSAILARWRTTTDNRSFYLRKNSSDQMELLISDDGINEYSIESSLVVVADQWYFVAAVFDQSASMTIWVSSPTTKKLVKDEDTTGIPAGSFPAALGNYVVGARNSAIGVHTDFLDGDIGLIWTGGYPTPEVQLWNAYQVARPLLGLR